MKYDFSTVIDRRSSDANAVNWKAITHWLPDAEIREGRDIIPMGVADMNFATVPTIAEEMIARAQHPLFGYFTPIDEYYDSITRWHETRNHVKGLTRDCIGYENGVLGGVLSALGVLCSKGDNVLVHSPTYMGFTFSLEGSGYHMVLSPLVKDADGIWRMDYEDMERKIVQNNIHAALFCTPHNPTGRVWEEDELKRMMKLFIKHDVYVVSDEIWSDIVLPGYHHIPLQNISDEARNRTIAIYAPSKTFNLAGLVGSYHIIYNKRLRDRVNKEESLSHYNEMNLMSMYALIGAYKPEGYEWVDELNETLYQNMAFAVPYINEHFRGMKAYIPEGTYMLFVDCSDFVKQTGMSVHEINRRGMYEGITWQEGVLFKAPDFMRMNLAMPLAQLKQGLAILEKVIASA